MIPYLTVHLDVAGRCVELRSHRRRGVWHRMVQFVGWASDWWLSRG